MAFQRPFLISLKRQDSNVRWGFGIKGGRDYDEPLMVQMVGDSSLAENCGLREGDEIIQVGRINVQDLTLGQAHEVLARCGNKIEMFVVREDLLTSKKGKDPPVVKAVVHNPYNSPLSLYSTENIAEELGKQTEVLTEGHLSTEEDEGPENLSFRQKSAVFQLLAEQEKQEGSVPARAAVQTAQVKKPTAAPPPPPKPKPPSNEQFYNGYDHQVYDHQDIQKTTSRTEYQTTKKVVQFQKEQPVQYQQQSTVYQYQTSPGYQSPTIREGNQAPLYQSSVSFESKQSPTPSYQNQNYQNYQQLNQQNHQTQRYQQPSQTYQQSNQSQYSVNINQQQPQYPGPQSPTYQPLNQVNYHQNQPNYQQHQNQVNYQQHQNQSNYQQHQNQVNYQQNQVNQQQSQKSQSQQVRSQQSQIQPPKTQPEAHQQYKAVPPPPPRSAQNDSSMTAVYKQQYEQHLQKQYEQQQQLMMVEEDTTKPRAHIIDEENFYEHNCTSGTPITYKAPPAAPPKPVWPPPAPSGTQHHERFRSPQPDSPPNGLLKNVAQVWPPKKSSAVELPRTGFNPAAVREQSGSSGRRCVWPPPDEHRTSGRSTPQSPQTGRRIQWNPSTSPSPTRRAYNSPSRRRDIQWPPPEGSTRQMNGACAPPRPSPRMSRKAQFDDYVHEHASINVPQTYRPPPGTQHIEFR